MNPSAPLRVNFASIGAVLGFLGVALGAFGAHALKNRLGFEALQVWHTAVFYHLIHSVVLVSLGLYARVSGVGMKLTGSFFLAGILIFSGSLYALALTGIKPLGAVTPLGGACLIAGWICLAFKTRR